MEGKEILIILQKFSLEILILAGLTSLIVYLINKFGSYTVKKFSVYYPYLCGIIFYGLYSLIFSLECEVSTIINMGITTGGVSCIFSSFFISQKNKQDMADNLLSGIISEKDLKIVKQKIQTAEDTTAVAEIISDYSIFPMSAKQAEIFAEIIISKNKGLY